MTGLLLLTYAVALPMLIAFAALHGVAWGLRGPFMQAIRADYFGRAAIGMILGLSYLIIVVGQVGGPMIAGIMADATGDYRAGFTILALLAEASEGAEREPDRRRAAAAKEAKEKVDLSKIDMSGMFTNLTKK